MQRMDFVSDQKPSRARPLEGLDCEQEVILVACLSPPRKDCVYRNVAIAPSVAVDGTAQIAVIWQDFTPAPRRSELYIYEIFPSFWQDHEARDNRSIAESSEKPSYSTYDSEYLDEESLSRCAQIQAKRIRSLSPCVGGIHPSSSLWQSLSAEDSKPILDYQAALGGLQILQTGDKVPFPIGTTATYQAIHVWGPNAAQISLTIFELSYAGPNLHTLPIRFTFPDSSYKLKRSTLICQKRGMTA